MKRKKYLITTYGNSKKKSSVIYIYKIKEGKRKGVRLILNEKDTLFDKIAEIPKEFFFESYEDAKKNLKKISRYANIADRLGMIPCREKLAIKKIWT